MINFVDESRRRKRPFLMKITIKDIKSLPEAASAFIREFDGSAAGRVFAFHAPMGTGKTTFISEVCRQLGSGDEASSPTFSIVNEYDTREWGRVYHLDCYRLDGEEDAFEVGVEEIFASGRPCFVEWPEKIEGLLPDDAVTVTLSRE